MKKQREKRKKEKAGAPNGAPAAKDRFLYVRRVGIAAVWGQKGKVVTALVVAVLLAFCFVATLLCAFSSPERALAGYLQAHTKEFPYVELNYEISDRQAYAASRRYLEQNTVSYSGSTNIKLMREEEFAAWGYTPVTECLPLTKDTFYLVIGPREELAEDKRIGSGVRLPVFGDPVYADGNWNFHRVYTGDTLVLDGEELDIEEYMEENGLSTEDMIGHRFKMYSMFLKGFTEVISQDPMRHISGDNEGTLIQIYWNCGFRGEEALERAKERVPVLTFGGVVRSTAFKPNKFAMLTLAWNKFPREDYILSAEWDGARLGDAVGGLSMRTLLRTDGTDLYGAFRAVGLDLDLTSGENCILIDAEGGYGSGYYRGGFENDDTCLVWNLKQMAQPLDTMRNVGLGASGVLAVLYMVMTSLTFASSFKKRKREFALMQAVGVPRRKVFLYCLAALGVFAGVILAAGIVAAWPLQQLLGVFVHIEWQGTVMTLVTLSGEAFGVLAAFVAVTALPAALLAAKSVYGGSVADRLREE